MLEFCRYLERMSCTLWGLFITTPFCPAYCVWLRLTLWFKLVISFWLFELLSLRLLPWDEFGKYTLLSFWVLGRVRGLPILC